MFWPDLEKLKERGAFISCRVEYPNALLAEVPKKEKRHGSVQSMHNAADREHLTLVLKSLHQLATE